MQIFSQKDPRWKDIKLGTCKDTIGSSGCFTTCYSIITGIAPDELNDYFIRNGMYSNGCLLNGPKASKALGLGTGLRIQKPNKICIAETDYYKDEGYKQHFYVLYPDGTIIDPLDEKPVLKKNTKYNAVSYRDTSPTTEKIQIKQKPSVAAPEAQGCICCSQCHKSTSIEIETPVAQYKEEVFSEDTKRKILKFVQRTLYCLAPTIVSIGYFDQEQYMVIVGFIISTATAAWNIK